ncbi:MCE family protein [Pseudonocardia sp. H11422]|uniref:MCE family protein n=1 Tax=Pseudonocardia sp. H11422 TaxID=2835866 RepID=UPI001BDD8DDD|nr:MCE family protein [Pseudonocardia sp. H11422]
MAASKGTRSRIDLDRRRLQFTALVAVVAVLVATGVWLVVRSPARTVTAYFTSAAALFEDNSVRVLGVQVGTIDKVVPEGTRVRVEMRIDDELRLPENVNAVVVSPSLVTGRYVQLSPAYSGGPELADGAAIPVERTAVPLDVDDLARTATELSNALGPRGANSAGAVSDALDVGAQNLDGNGRALNDTLRNLGELSGTLANSREDLFGTVRELQSFTSTIAANDDQVREFNTRLADVSSFLAAERGDLGAALAELSVALGEVAEFVEDNRAALASNVDKLTDVTAVLVKQQKALAEILDVAPAAISNFANTYNGSSGTLDTRLNLNELTMPPGALVCELIRRSNPEQLNQVDIKAVCDPLLPIIDGTVPLPSPAEVITALQSGVTPPVPGLAVPTVPTPDPATGGDR